MKRYYYLLMLLILIVFAAVTFLVYRAYQADQYFNSLEEQKDLNSVQEVSE